MFNDSLLANWRWGVYHNSWGLWGQILESKHRGWKGLREEDDCRNASTW